MQRFAVAAMKLIGWRVLYKPLPGPRGVIVVYPHTSNWDFVVGVFAMWAIGMPFHFIAKSSLFEGITGATVGRLVRYLGGEPVERNASTGAIARLAERINRADWYWLAITPEGTRSQRPYWRSGFYHIALAARIPVGCAYFDFSKKEIGLVDYLPLSGDADQDMAAIGAILHNIQGCRPEKASPIQLRPED
ncbi:1-acyl-sn-glycerol-3-phosphate acyltransferase [Undibacterium sp. Jales W-56]|uniref:1-acyl-sn-glycerol-3-phosphate acyltransferase n=1 Tax=Undibacterium sp. Jales W-56 TaxID=2897325 RepID=UPI0021CF87E1|nr:1-acyl-sn-glycerol-3-phosphate acyltransferase [Undibacterium sp. Jales W-56]MCU6432198.1 1-acyl-sn-glycerol-3-phosphate acyltransferase [Undibacterium sp. Jales W-56]